MSISLTDEWVLCHAPGRLTLRDKGREQYWTESLWIVQKNWLVQSMKFFYSAYEEKMALYLFLQLSNVPIPQLLNREHLLQVS